MTEQQEQPLITIGITCFNAEDTISRAIESALAQDWPHKEILVVDDKSTDGSCEVVRRFEGENVRLIVHKENTGPGGARNTLVKDATGDFLVFFDDDDESYPQRLHCQYETIRTFEDEYPDAFCACYASGTRLYPSGYEMELKAIGQASVYPHGKAMAGRVLYFGAEIKDWNYGITPTCALMARTKTFRDVGGFDPAFRRVEDLDFVVRLALAGGYFIGTKNKLFCQHATEAGDKSYEKNFEAERQLVKKHEVFLRDVGYYHHAYLWPELRYHHFKKQYGRFILTFLKLMMKNPVHTVRHFLQTGPKRLRHEKRMKN